MLQLWASYRFFLRKKNSKRGLFEMQNTKDESEMIQHMVTIPLADLESFVSILERVQIRFQPKPPKPPKSGRVTR
jgi:hypothetical protein